MTNHKSNINKKENSIIMKGLSFTHKLNYFSAIAAFIALVLALWAIIWLGTTYHGPNLETQDVVYLRSLNVHGSISTHDVVVIDGIQQIGGVGVPPSEITYNNGVPSAPGQGQIVVVSQDGKRLETRAWPPGF